MTGPDVRIGLFGNVANALFELARELRSIEGFDVHLFVADHDAYRPEHSDPSLLDGYPSWIHGGPWITPRSVLAPWRSPIVAELSRFDLLVVSGPGPLYAQFASTPWCWFVTGADLTVKPFPLTFWRRYSTWTHRAGELVGGVWQRRAARRADELWIQPFAPMVDAVQRLGIADERVSHRYFPLVVDTDLFTPDHHIAEPTDPAVVAMEQSEFCVLHPSRLVIASTEPLRRTGQWKANDVLLHGYAEFVRRRVVERPLLVIPDVVGGDIDIARRIVADEGIDHAVHWAVPPAPAGFPRHRLVDLYAVADVVADDFGAGWFGYVALEGAAMAKPVVTHVDPTAMADLYPDGNPFCEAADATAVADRLEELATDPARRLAAGEAGRSWILRHHTPEALRQRYREGVGDAVERLCRPVSGRGGPGRT